MTKKLRRADYHVAWIAPVSDLELLPSRLMLDEEHEAPRYDDNVYMCGTMKGHNVVIVTCPQGLTGNVNAGRVAGPMLKTFSGLRMVLLVGVGSGIPRAYPSADPTEDVHVGDVVVGWPGDGGPACVYYDSGQCHLDKPDRILLNALAKLASDHEVGQTTFQEHRDRLLQSKQREKFTLPGPDKDRLFQASYSHHGPKHNHCAQCDSNNLVQRPARTKEEEAEFVFHQGRIATGNTAIRDGERRDQIRELCNGALCIETEAAGVDASGRCLVIRGIADYADTHSNDTWRSYAAGNAAVFARELLCKIPPSQVRGLERLKPRFLVPFGRNEGFVGREDILAQLLERTPPTAYPDTCQRTVIEGLGGIGKTQVAMEAAYRVRDAHSDCAVFWVPAVNMTMFENTYRDIGRALEIHGMEDDKADVKALVKTALSQEEAGSWLLVVDNADDAALLFGGDQLLSHLPWSRKGSILFTTRNHQAAVRFEAREHIYRLTSLDYCESVQLLHQGLQPGQIGEPHSTAALLNYLVHLPLAIRQAAAFMGMNSNVAVPTYLGYCRSSNHEMVEILSKDFDDRDRYDAIENPIATTWLISFRHIKRDNRFAAEYLQFCCFLAEKDIPVSLLPQQENKIKRDEAIGTLAAYAFIQQRNVPYGMLDRFDIHRLVRLAMRNWLREKGEEEEQFTRTICGLAQALPPPTHETRQEWAGYLPHTEAAVAFEGQCAEKRALWTVLLCTGSGNEIHGKYVNAEPFNRQAVKVAREVFGAEHPSTLSSMNNLANVLSSQGKYEEAERMHRQTVQQSEKALGAEHPDTLSSMNNLASVLSSQGKYEEAERMHRQTVQQSEKALGAEHPDTLSSMNNLASVLSSQGKYEEAERMHRQTVQQREKALGAEHPSTLTSMNNLASVLSSQGKYEEAERMHRQTVQRREKALGAEHPDTLGSMNNLAEVLSSQGKYEEAERMHRQTVQQSEKALGAEHPDTLGSMNNLANVLSSQGKYEEAERMHWQTVQQREKALGAEHPDTLASMNNLAEVLSSQGKYEEAERMHRQTVQQSEKALGAEHPSTLGSMNNLANVLSSQGKYEEAERMHRQTVQQSEKALGAEHPSTLTSMNNLASVLSSQGKYEEAERMHRQTVQRREKALGAEHPSTLTSMNNLAEVLSSQGKYEEAERMHRQTVQQMEKVLGAEHPLIHTSMNNLATVLGSQGKYEEAERMHRQTLDVSEKALGRENPFTLLTISNLAESLRLQEKYDEAEQLHQQTLALREKVLGREHPDTLASMSYLAAVRQRQLAQKRRFLSILLSIVVAVASVLLYFLI
ncbi:hypothetical protein PG991_011702 [Apiospora marii]|uniref:NB-ARC domain-containing protein n=1 Tax=Apiospora marii TaxID=335849 RepID=A0ABR1RH10_9PEZI